MNDEGIIRSLDPMGRVVIPKEMRKLLNVMDGDKVRIIKKNNSVIIKRVAGSCFVSVSYTHLDVYKRQELRVSNEDKNWREYR